MKKSIIILTSLIILTGCGANNKENSNDQDINNEDISVKEEKKVSIVDTQSNQRTYAVMINNHKAARPQSGVQDAYIVYELMVEGGITRMLALYRDATTSKIGSVRSSRHYYLDYVLENDAIYFHWGGSPQAYNDIEILKIQHVDAIGSVFWKDKNLNRATEHTAFTSIENMTNYINNKNIRNTTNQPLLLEYSTDDIELDKLEDSVKADSVSIKYSNYQTVTYIYDDKNKVYKRQDSGTYSVDLVTGTQYTTKNIIVYDLKYSNIPNDTSGRQNLDNIGTGKGYYITNGYAIPITWEKKERASQTIYKYISGEEIKVNDGNTFIQIYPTTGTLTIN